MGVPEKDAASFSTPETPIDAPPAYTPLAQSSGSLGQHEGHETHDERNPATIPSTMGPKKVYTTYHMYLEQNYMRKVKVALAKHLNSEIPSYLFEFPDQGEHAGKLVMRGNSTAETQLLGTASFATDFGKSRLELSDARVAEVSVVPRADKSQKTRLFRLDMENSSIPQHHHPATMFWEMGTRNHGGSQSGVGNYELMDEERKVYAVLLTSHHKSMKKIGRLHWLVEPREELVHMGLGTLMSIWKKAERDVRSGHIGLRV